MVNANEENDPEPQDDRVSGSSNCYRGFWDLVRRQRGPWHTKTILPSSIPVTAEFEDGTSYDVICWALQFTRTAPEYVYDGEGGEQDEISERIIGMIFDDGHPCLAPVDYFDGFVNYSYQSR